MRQRRSTAFYVESLLLVLFILAAAAVLVQTFAAARGQALEARRLTGGQQVAQNISEYFYAASGEDDFWQLLEDDPAFEVGADGTVRTQASGEAFLARAEYSAQPGTAGRMDCLTLAVCAGEDGEKGEVCRMEFRHYQPR